MGKIGVYGGSFNPPHLGHALAVREMIRTLDLDRLILVPAAVPPHKSLAAGSPEPRVRLQMLALQFGDIEHVEIDDQELNREGPSYTVETIQALHARFPGDSLFLLMGTDMFLSFDSWFEPEEICRYVTIVTVHRSADDVDACNRLKKQAERIQKSYGARVILLDNQFVEVSSTEVRRMLRFQCAESYLDPRVLEYIVQNRLYGVGEDLRNLPFESLRKVSLSLHDPRRVPHVIGCCQTAAQLARRWGADEALAARAGILHDVTKALTKTAQLLLCEKYGIMTNAFERQHYKLLHAKTAAAVAQHVFGESASVVDAIFWHTTGKARMSKLEKILYLADYMEPNRNFEGVETLRKLADEDLDAALLCGFEMTISLLKSEGKALNHYTEEARDFLLGERIKA